MLCQTKSTFERTMERITDDCDSSSGWRRCWHGPTRNWLTPPLGGEECSLWIEQFAAPYKPPALWVKEKGRWPLGAWQAVLPPNPPPAVYYRWLKIGCLISFICAFFPLKETARSVPNTLVWMTTLLLSSDWWKPESLLFTGIRETRFP